MRNVGCAVRSRAPGFISSAAGACERAACLPLICVYGLGDVRGRGVCGAPPPGGDDPADHGPRRWFGAQAHAGCACIRPVSQDSRLASSLLRTVRTLADGVWESPHGASPSLGPPVYVPPTRSLPRPVGRTAVRVPRHPRIKGMELRG